MRLGSTDRLKSHLRQKPYFIFNFIEVWLIYYVVLTSAVQQSDSVIYVCVCIYIFHNLFHYGLSQDIEYSSLYYTAGPCCLFILYIMVYIC